MRPIGFPLFISLFTVALFCPVSAGQFPETGAGRFELRFREPIPVEGQTARSIFYPVRCDGNGNLYFQPGWVIPGHREPVLKYSPEGRHLAVFSLDKVPQFEGGIWYRFNVGLRGEVYFVAARLEAGEPHVAILKFSSEGVFRSATKLAEAFRPRAVAVFLSGEFLVSGIQEYRDEGGARRERPFTGIFDRGGRLVAEVHPPDDGNLDSPTDAENAAGRGPRQTRPADAIELGDALAGEDGNIYLVRRTADPSVFVLSPGGEVVRSFVVRAPEETAQMAGVTTSGAGRLVFDFRIPGEPGRPSQQLLTLVDAI
jgi:hypothetical protein